MTTITPSPAPLTLSMVAADLARPFPFTQIEIKPGALTRDGEKCLAMPYADLRAYETRLDDAVGLESWGSTYVMTDRGVVCALTILGVTKSGIGDYPLDAKDENAATSAQAQAFKRACSAFGIGRYLYGLNGLWVAYDKERRRVLNPERAAWELYSRAGLLSPDERRQPPAVTPPKGGAGR